MNLMEQWYAIFFEKLRFARKTLFYCLHTLVGGGDGLDAAVGVELHLVDAGLAVPAGTFAPVDIVLVDAVVYDVPLILAGYLKHAVVCGAIDFLVGTLDEDDGLVGYLDGAEG